MAQDELRGDTLLVTVDERRDEEVNRLMAEALRDAVGARDVRLVAPGARPLDAEGARDRSRVMATLHANRMLIGITLAALLVVAAIVAVTTGSWWVLGGVVALHGLATLVFIAFVFSTARTAEKPGPGLVARLEELGVPDPEAEIDRRVVALRQGEGETAAEQEEAWTPASGDNPDIRDKERYESAQRRHGRRREQTEDQPRQGRRTSGE